MLSALLRGYSLGYTGGIDELSIYNRVLNAPEIKAIYLARATGKMLASANMQPGQAAGVVLLSNGSIIGVAMTDGGASYTNVPSVSVLGGGGDGAVLRAHHDQWRDR